MTVQQSASRSAAATVFVVSAATFLASLDLFIVNVAFPDIRRTFHNADLASMSWILNAYTIVFAAVLTPAGRLGDRYGHRRIFLLGLTVFLAGSLACGLSTTFAMLVASRVLQALGAGMLMPSSLALLLAAVPADRRTRAVGHVVSRWRDGGSTRTPLGGVLVGFSWQWIFIVNLPVGALVVAVGRFVLRETRPSGSDVPDLIGALALVVGVAALVWALIEVPTVSDGTIVALAATVGVAAITVTVWRSHGHHTPIIDLVAIRATPLWISCLMQVLFATAFGAMLLGNVLFLIIVWRQTPAVAGLLLSPGAVVVVVVSATVTGRLIDRCGVGFVAASGAVLYAAGAIMWLCRVGPDPNYLGDFLPGQILTGTGIGLVIPSLSSVPGRALPAHRWGAGSALMNTARQLGSVLGTVIVTFVYQPVIELAAVRLGWVVITAAAVASALVAVALAVNWGAPAGDATNTSLRRGSDKRTFIPLVGRRPGIADETSQPMPLRAAAQTPDSRQQARVLAQIVRPASSARTAMGPSSAAAHHRSSADHFQCRVSSMRLAIVARRQRHFPPEFSTEVACVAESPAVRDRGDREVRVHEIVSGGGQAVLPDDRSDGVSGCFECAVDGSGRNVVCGSEIPDPDGAAREVVHDPRLQLSPEQRQELAAAHVGELTCPDHPGDQGEQGVASGLDLHRCHAPIVTVDADEEVLQDLGERILRCVHE